jgi:hypothetical protein
MILASLKKNTNFKIITAFKSCKDVMCITESGAAGETSGRERRPTSPQPPPKEGAKIKGEASIHIYNVSTLLFIPSPPLWEGVGGR